MLTPVGKKLMVQVLKEESKSGLILPSEDKKGKKLEYGKVITVGKACDSFFKPEMIVYFDHFAGTAITIDSEDYLMIKEEEICAIGN